MAEKPKKDEEAIFYQALEKSPEDRETYLKKACGDDSELYSRVEALLRSNAVDDSFLESLALDAEVTLDKSPLAEGPGTVIGAYKLLEKIGEGGMAVVYMAEQKEPLRRKVALKVIKLGMDTKRVIARFEAERQALAIMDHPNVAKVFDAGATETGRPYFVMELVKGVSITEYCDKNKLSTKERLDLFIQVCNAVQHAHQKGIIHRDIKPSNVMVTMHDDKAVPKVIDFGIAKATGQKLTEKTLFTRYAQMIGTPTYMSPEQAQFSGLDIDTRTDIYSLGVLLYELLTGTTPFDAKELCEAGYLEIQRIIQETEPPKPSTKLSTMGEALTGVAEHRKTNPDLLPKLVRGDLDWIVMKTLEKDRTRRYETANALAADIKRHFDDEPVEASPPSTLYRTRKFIQKHRRTVAAVAVVAAVLIIGLIVSTTLYLVADRARGREAVARTEAEQARDKEAALRAEVEQALLRTEEAEKLAKERAEDYRRSLYFNRIALADASYNDSNISRVRELLDLCPEDLRGWEWDRLWHLSHQALMTLSDHEGYVLCASFSPDGKRIVTASADKTVKVRDAATGSELMTLRGHEAEVWYVAYSPDSSKIASGSGDNTIKIWDAATGDQVKTLRGHESWVWTLAFSPNSRRIVSGGNGDKTVKVWDAMTGEEVMTLRGHEGYVSSVKFSPDGQHIVSGSSDYTIKVWDVRSGAEIMTLKGHDGRVSSVAFSPDGQHLASSGRDNTIKVWEAATGAELMTLRGHEGWVGHVSFSPDGSKIVSGSMDNTIKVWDAMTGEEVMTLRGHGGWVSSVAFSPDGKSIISASFDKTVKVWDSVISGEETTLHGHNGRVRHAVFSPDGKRIVSGGGDKTIKVWDAVTGSEVMTLRGHEGPIADVSFSPDSKYIVSGSLDKTIKVWDAATGTELMTMRGHQGIMYSAVFTPDGRHIVSGSVDKMIKIWDAATGAEVMTLEGQESWIRSVAVSPDGKRIVSGGGDKTITVWNAVTGSEVMTLHGHEESVSCVSFSPDSKYIASGSLDKTIKVWDAATGVELMTLRGHKNRVNCVIFSPDGKRIITGGVLRWD